jgi:hypothetical protein
MMMMMMMMMMIIIIIIIIHTITSNKKTNNIGYFEPLLTSSTRKRNELHCILLLDYKFTLSKYDINDTRLVGLEVRAIGM